MSQAQTEELVDADTDEKLDIAAPEKSAWFRKELEDS